MLSGDKVVARFTLEPGKVMVLPGKPISMDDGSFQVQITAEDLGKVALDA